MIPDFIKPNGCLWEVLPQGIHDSTLAEVRSRFAINSSRDKLFQGMSLGVEHLFRSGCTQVFLDGSYITSKPIPNDYEICWDVRLVNPTLVDPVFFDFTNKRHSQKLKFLGEYFPTMLIEGNSGKPFLEFFQIDKESGNRKGIVRLLNHLKKGDLL